MTNHLAQTAAIDFFTVPTATFRVLFVFVVLSHERRRVLHFGVTEHPTQKWTTQQMREAFPWDQAPRFVLRDRDAIYGTDFAAMTRDMRMEQVLTAPQSPWQNPFVERLVGSIRRECLDHVIVWNERSLRRTLHNYFAYYQRSRTHLALGKDVPEARAVAPPEQGCVVAIPQVGDYTTDINDALLSRSKSVASMFALLSGNERFSLIYATKPLLIKTGFGRDKNSLQLDALEDWTRQRLPAFRLGCACREGKCIHEICD